MFGISLAPSCGNIERRKKKWKPQRNMKRSSFQLFANSHHSCPRQHIDHSFSSIMWRASTRHCFPQIRSGSVPCLVSLIYWTTVVVSCRDQVDCTSASHEYSWVLLVSLEYKSYLLRSCVSLLSRVLSPDASIGRDLVWMTERSGFSCPLALPPSSRAPTKAARIIETVQWYRESGCKRECFGTLRIGRLCLAGTV